MFFENGIECSGGVSLRKEHRMEIIKGKKSDSYRESIAINGKVIKSPLFKRKTDCKLWLSEKRSEKSKFKLFGENNKFHHKITIEQYSAQWLKTKEAQGVSRSTLNNYSRYVRIHIIPHFKGMDLKSIQKHHIESFQVKLKNEHNPKGVNIIITGLKGLFREAVKEGYLLKNPCEFIKTLTSDNNHEVFWTTAEVDQFLKANYHHELYELFMVALNTGMRKGELAGLCYDRINFNENTITVTRTRDKYELKDRTKTKLKRVIPMNEITKATLLNLFKNRISGNNLVFLKKNGEPINPHHIYRQFRSAQKAANIVNLIRFHDIRHTFASQYVLGKGSIYDLQKFLGHTNIVMTQRYAHLSMEHLQSAMKGFSLGAISFNQGSTQNEVVLFKKDDVLEKLTQNPPKIFNLSEVV